MYLQIQFIPQLTDNLYSYCKNMEEKKTIVRNLNEAEQQEFDKQMDFLSTEMKELHQKSAIMEHEAHQGAAHAFLNC